MSDPKQRSYIGKTDIPNDVLESITSTDAWRDLLPILRAYAQLPVFFVFETIPSAWWLNFIRSGMVGKPIRQNLNIHLHAQ